MPLCSPPLATVIRLCLVTLLVWVCLLQPVFAQDSKDGVRHLPVQPPPLLASSKKNETGHHLLCTPFGACEPCPRDAMNEPFCQPFGNRRLMHCVNTTTTTLLPPPPPNSNNPNHPPPNRFASPSGTPQPEGEILAWESCGRIVAKERADFYEFVACNVVFALIALGVLFFRSRRMQMMQAKQLAVRIGLIRGDGNGRDVRP